MHEKLAFFPLQLVVYPGEALNLHVFEPRYRQLIRDAESEGITFGVPTVIKGEMLPIATEVELVEVSKRYASGESDIRTIGRRVFQIKKFHPTLGRKLYAGGDVQYLYVEEEEDYLINEEIVVLIREIYRAMKVDKFVKHAHQGFRTYDVAHYCGFDLKQEYKFLTLFNAVERQQYMLDHLRTIRPERDSSQNDMLRNRAELNGHFKHLNPPKF
ncbi:peptidase [Lewinellaceae bacterium SD302]|nr:peptidase [Lewinellaceae bacterium SD302]